MTHTHTRFKEGVGGKEGGNLILLIPSYKIPFCVCVLVKVTVTVSVFLFFPYQFPPFLPPKLYSTAAYSFRSPLILKSPWRRGYFFSSFPPPLPQKQLKDTSTTSDSLANAHVTAARHCVTSQSCCDVVLSSLLYLSLHVSLSPHSYREVQGWGGGINFF